MNLKKIQKEFYKAFKMQLGIGEKKAETLSEVAITVLLQEANKLKTKKLKLK